MLRKIPTLTTKGRARLRKFGKDKDGNVVIKNSSFPMVDLARPAELPIGDRICGPKRGLKNAKKRPTYGDYMLAPHHSSRNLKSGVFTEKSLPDGKKMKILNRKVFNGAVKAAMDVKKAHD